MQQRAWPAPEKASENEREQASESQHEASKKLELAWDLAQAEIGVKATVILEEIAEVQRQRAQAQIHQQLLDIKKQFAALRANRAQAQMARGP